MIKRKKREPFTEEDVEILHRYYTSHGAKFCCSLMKDREPRHLWYKARKLGIQISKETFSKLHEKNNFEDFAVSPEKFTNIVCPIVSYVLGIMWADGHLDRNSIFHNAVRRDAEILFPIFLKTGQWKIKHRLRKNDKNWQSVIFTSNKFIFQLLTSLRYRSKHESACLILELIPDEIKHYWFRGLIDGDGCIGVDKKGRYRVSVSGPYNQDWTYLENLFNKMGIRYSIRKTDNYQSNHHIQGRGSSINIMNKGGFLKFLNYIYQGMDEDKIGLPRKYNKFLEGLRQIEKYKIKRFYSKLVEMKNTETQEIKSFPSFNEAFSFLKMNISYGGQKLKTTNIIKGWELTVKSRNSEP